jgi:predicted Rossmann fold flavoprotein
VIETDVVIIGAGAAGLLCAIEAGKRGRRVVVLDHARKPAEKIRISGGGRCNFTNLRTSPQNYLSQNPHFCMSALARYTPHDFIALVEKHNIAYHEKTAGQLFCDHSSQQIINMLLEECRQAGVKIQLNAEIQQVTKPDESFHVGDYRCQSLVVACGGLSIPKMGATNLGYRIARDFGLSIMPTQPALVPFTLSEAQLAVWQPLAGVSLQANVKCGKQQFQEGLLFTHRGLSGPAILQISSYWQPGSGLDINLAPGHDAAAELIRAKAANQSAVSVLTTMLPKRLAQQLAGNTRLAATPDRQLAQLGEAVNRWHIVPNGTEGYRTAEVTLGGVDTNELSSKTLEARKVANLYFIGEVLDVTGHLGGYNFQWAWASGYVAGQYA